MTLLLIVLLGPWLVLGVNYATKPRPTETPTDTTASPTTEGATPCAPGPWGNLEYIRILTEPPEQQVGGSFPAIDHVKWTFPGYTNAQLDALWQAAGLTSAELAVVDRPDNREFDLNRITILAPKDLVFNLTAEARKVIYTALSVFPENYPYAEPYRFTVSARDEWFKDSGLKPETIALVERLLFQRGNSLLFSDQALV
ncbi:MAG: hypothetical protein KDK74_11915, partial [Cephaloticoccus sp.]|nr:hypothetical protein [Cephaloticoccus sp.]